MRSKQYIAELFQNYLQLFPAEAERCEIFAGFLSRNNDEQLYHRKNFDGHITTSAFIIRPATEEMLLLHHKALNKWLQPGGHVEADADLVASALREAVEESGIPVAELQYKPIHSNPLTPFDIDSHYIPANPRKDEDGHYHHDIRYIFVYTGDGGNSYNEEEATGMRWVGFHDLEHDAIFGSMVTKLRTALQTA